MYQITTAENQDTSFNCTADELGRANDSLFDKTRKKPTQSNPIKIKTP